ncbi:MAG: DUF2933 domain-containing protein [Paludibacterium sp.]|uniref:DUF2933 domain-containing protein n=1 Tax=Paludibacterium sp. TaxID=1917523 RepID=UPI0025EED3F4|nr:DUF2933 domain-containing protein [Paludibacterium sp.]MBV8049328.1 DUF2933 domain-containing protein [Paludibacterium sp.]MBV8646993.1 DUF2933 domain-containing protein [Paludibacterium sp.]
MKSCCSNGNSRWPMFVVMGLLAFIAGWLVLGHGRGAAWTVLPLLSGLICPLMMVFMMFGMPHRHEAAAKPAAPAADRASE